MNKNKLTNCKTCGAEVAKNAKTCPQCGAKLKAGHPILIGILIVFVLLVFIGALGSSDEPTKVETDGNAQGNNSSQTEVNKEANKKDKFAVGETVELNDVNVTLVNVSTNAGSEFNRPTEGNEFILCEFEIDNKSNREINVSSLMSFNAYCDDYTCNFSLGALIEKENKNQLDGTVAPGKKFNGVVGYEVPKDWKNFEVKFTPDFWGGKAITFVANNK